MTVNVVNVSPVSASVARFMMLESPDLTQIPSEPLVSCLCVTENRHAFIPWLLWNFDRQTWKKRELIIVDSSQPPIMELSRRDVRIIRVPPGTWLGKKRNLALQAARGQVIAWFDDDDWQHSRRLEFSIPLLRQHARTMGVSFLGPSRSYFVDLYSDRIQAHFMNRCAIFNGSVYYTNMVRHIPFPENVLRSEDSIWHGRLLRRCRGAALDGEQPILFLWLSHDANISNVRAWRCQGRNSFSSSCLPGLDCPDLQRQLEALRKRIEKRPAQPPRRAVLLEGATLERNHGAASTSAFGPEAIRDEPIATLRARGLTPGGRSLRR